MKIHDCILKYQVYAPFWSTTFFHFYIGKNSDSHRLIAGDGTKQKT